MNEMVEKNRKKLRDSILKCRDMLNRRKKIKTMQYNNKNNIGPF